MNLHRLAIALIPAALALLAACGGEEEVLPTATPVAEAKFVPDLESQTQALMLHLISPKINQVTNSDRVSVSGVTSPDATLSVNGHMAFLDAQGRFSISLDRHESENPMAVEVIATSITGESETLVRPVVFSGGPGVFGTIAAVTPSNFTMDTESGPVTLSFDSATTVRIHGWKSPSVTNIDTGSQAAVLTDGPRAVSVIAVPGRPARSRHFTGLVVGSGPVGLRSIKSLTLRDDSGRRVTATMADGLDDAQIGELVTSVLVQDLSTGSLTVTAYDPAISGAARLLEALEFNQASSVPQATDNIAALRWRLTEHGVRNLSLLINGKPSDSTAGTVEGWRRAVAIASDFYEDQFARYRIGAASADVTGLVTSMDSGTGEVTVQPALGPAVMVRISAATPVTLFGERVRSGQLDLASRVTVRYALSGNDASRIAVMAGNTLPNDSLERLARTAGRGEIQGTLIEVGPEAAIITILDRATGRRISLPTADGSSVLRDGAPAVLDSNMEGTNVFAWYDPDTYRLLELESITPQSGEELLSGVVHSFIPKFAEGNLTISTPDGRLRSFTHQPETLIRRHGLRVSIGEVRLGDLVRPNTRVRRADGTGRSAGEIVLLSLKTPEPGLVIGVIRGVNQGPDGEVTVTISDIWLELTSLKIGPGAVITQQGGPLAVEDLAVGQAVTFGTYDPVTMAAVELKVDPPWVSTSASLVR